MKTHPDTLLSELKARLHKRAHPNLDHVHAACRSIFEGPGTAGRKDYSTPTVARLLEAQGKSPNYNTLNSPGGSHFKALVRAWAQWDGTDILKPPTPSTPEACHQHADLLRQIFNPAVRAEIGFLLADLRRTRGELNTLKARTTPTIDRRPKDGLPQAHSQPLALASTTTKPLLLETERHALQKALDPQYLRRLGLTPGPDGDISDNKTTLFPVGFLTGLQKLLDLNT